MTTTQQSHPDLLLPKQPASTFGFTRLRAILWELVAPTPRRSQTRLERCHGCGYWLTSRDHYCADCGLFSSHSAAPWQRRVYLREVEVMFCVGAVGLVALPIIHALAGSPSWAPLLGAGLLMLFGCVLYGMALGQRAVQRARWFGRTRECLRAYERRVKQLLAKNAAVMQRIQESRDLVAEILGTDPTSDSLAVLDSRTAARVRESHQYQAQLWDMDFARWFNALQPLVAGIERITYAQSKHRIGQASEILSAGLAMRDEWRASGSATSEAGKATLNKLDEAIGGLVVVIEELARRNALLADTNATHLRVPLADRPALARELERFERLSAGVAAGEFSRAIEELEQERFRLLGEAAVEVDVDQVLHLSKQGQPTEAQP